MNYFKLKDILKEISTDSDAVKRFVEYYTKRGEQLVAASKHANSSFFFHVEVSGEKLWVAVDMAHIDIIPFEDKSYEQMYKYIPYVIRALKEVGIEARPGMYKKGKNIILHLKQAGTVFVSDYQTDSLTVVLEIDDINHILQTNMKLAVDIVDSFMVKCIKAEDFLETEEAWQPLT